MQTKTCKQCGELKPIDQFRKYYGGRQGHYTICKDCERINSRAKYLERKGDSITSTEDAELKKIYRLYDAQRACGLQPPRRESGRQTRLVDDLDSMISKYEVRANVPTTGQPTFDTSATPPEILQWLSAELTEEPDYYLDVIYEELVAKYRPVIKIDAETLLPVHDEKHTLALEQVLSRFNKYDDDYWR